MSTFDLFSPYNEENQDEIPVRRDSARKSARSADKKRKRGRSKNSSKENEDSDDEELITSEVEEITSPAEPKSDKKKQAPNSRPNDVFELFDDTEKDSSETEQEEQSTSEQKTASIEIKEELEELTEPETAKVEIESEEPEEVVETVEEQAKLEAVSETDQDVEESTTQEKDEETKVEPEIAPKEEAQSTDENVVSESKEIENATDPNPDLETKEKIEELEKPEIDELSDTVNQLLNLVQHEKEETVAPELESEDDSTTEEKTDATKGVVEVDSIPVKEEKPKPDSTVRSFPSLKRTPAKKDEEEVLTEETEAKQEIAKPFMSLKRSVSKPLEEEKVVEKKNESSSEDLEVDKFSLTTGSEVENDTDSETALEAEVISEPEEIKELQEVEENERETTESSEIELDEIIDEIAYDADLSIKLSEPQIEEKQSSVDDELANDIDDILDEITDSEENELFENEDSGEFSDEIGLSESSKSLEKPLSFGFTETSEQEKEETHSSEAQKELEPLVEKVEPKTDSISNEKNVEFETKSISDSELKIEINDDSQENESASVATEPEIISEIIEEETPVIEEVQEEKPKKRSFFNLNKLLSKPESEPEKVVESTPVLNISNQESQETKHVESKIEDVDTSEAEAVAQVEPESEPSPIIEETQEEPQEELDSVSDSNVKEETFAIEPELETQVEDELEPEPEPEPIRVQEEIKEEELKVSESIENEIQDETDSDEIKSVVLPALGSLKSRLHPARARRTGFQMPELPKKITEKLAVVDEKVVVPETQKVQEKIEIPAEKIDSQAIVSSTQEEITKPSKDPVTETKNEISKASIPSKNQLDEVDDSLIDELIIEEINEKTTDLNEVEIEPKENVEEVENDDTSNEDNAFLDDLIHDVIEDDPILAKTQLLKEEYKTDDEPVGNQLDETEEEANEKVDAESENAILDDSLFETLLGDDFTADALNSSEDEEPEIEAQSEDEIEEENDFQLGDVDFSDIFDQLIEDALDDDSESTPTLDVDDLLKNETKQKEDSALKKNQSLQGAIHLIDESISALNDLEGGSEEQKEEEQEEEIIDSSEITEKNFKEKELVQKAGLDIRGDKIKDLAEVKDEESPEDEFELDEILESVIDTEEIDPVHEALFGNHSTKKEVEQELENDSEIETKDDSESLVDDDIFGVNEAFYHPEKNESKEIDLEDDSLEKNEELELESDLIEETVEEDIETIVAENEELEDENDNEDPVIAAKVSDDITENDDSDDVLDEILHLSQNEEDFSLSSSELNEKDEVESNLDKPDEDLVSEETESTPEIEIEEPDWYLEILAGMNKPSEEKTQVIPDSEVVDSDDQEEEKENLKETTTEEIKEESEEVLDSIESEKTASSWTPERESKIPVYVSSDSVKKENEFKKREARGKFKKQQEESSAVNANGDQMPLPDFDPLAIYKGMVRRWFIINRHTIGLFIGGLIAFRNALPKSRTRGLKFAFTRMASFFLKVFVAKELRDKSFAFQLRRRLELMGPTYIKLGQILALREDILPPVVTEELKNLLDRLPQIPFADIRGIVEAELGMKLEECFKDVNRSPIGTASIAQTHFATTVDDEKVVLKVVKPGIRDSILTDIRLLKLISGFLQWAIPQYQPKMLIDEFCAYTEKEVDLTNEADHAEIFAANFIDMEGVRFPKIYREYSGQDVLCMEFMAGYKPGHERMSELEMSEREYLVDRGAASIIQMLYKDGFFHADLHPGNLMIMDGALGFIDLGMVGRFEDKTRRRMLYYFHALVTGDIDGATKYLLAMAKIGEGGDPQGFRRAVADVLRRYYMHSQSGDFSLGKLILNSLSIGGKYRVFFPVEMTLMVKALVTFEGVGYMLVPKLDIPALSEKYVSKIFRDQFNPKAITQELMRGAPELVDMLVQLPKISADGLKFLEEFMNDRTPSNPLEGVKGAIIAGALLVGGVISLVQGSHFGVYTTLFALSALFAMFGK